MRKRINPSDIVFKKDEPKVFETKPRPTNVKYVRVTHNEKGEPIIPYVIEVNLDESGT